MRMWAKGAIGAVLLVACPAVAGFGGTAVAAVGTPAAVGTAAAAGAVAGRPGGAGAPGGTDTPAGTRAVRDHGRDLGRRGDGGQPALMSRPCSPGSLALFGAVAPGCSGDPGTGRPGAADGRRHGRPGSGGPSSGDPGFVAGGACAVRRTPGRAPDGSTGRAPGALAGRRPGRPLSERSPGAGPAGERAGRRKVADGECRPAVAVGGASSAARPEAGRTPARAAPGVRLLRTLAGRVTATLGSPLTREPEWYAAAPGYPAADPEVTPPAFAPVSADGDAGSTRVAPTAQFSRPLDGMPPGNLFGLAVSALLVGGAVLMAIARQIRLGRW